MANEDLFEFSAKMDIEVEKSSLDKAKGVLDSFYKKYNDRTMKVDTSDMVKAFRGGVLEMRKLYDQGVKEMSKNGFAWWESEDGADEMFNGIRAQMQEMLKDAKIVFSDGSIFSVLDNTLDDIFNDKIAKGITVAASDLGDRVQFLKDEISNAIGVLRNVGAIQSSHWGVYGFAGDDMTASQLEDRIAMLKKMVEYQAELEIFNGKKFEYEVAPTGMTSVGINSRIKELQDDLELLEKYNLRTTEQLKRRKDLINSAQESWQWDDDEHSSAKEQIKDNEAYEQNIAYLQSYIDQRKEIIRKLKDSEYELFSVDGISEYVNDANAQITRLETCMQELVDLRNGKQVDADPGFVGNISEVVKGLDRVEQAIRDVVTAFKPLTDALSSEDSAISALVNTSIADLQKLQEEVKETFANIKTLSQKEFVNQTVVSQAAPRNSALSTYRNEAKTLLANMVDLAKQINNVNISGFKDKVGLTTADQMFANNFLVDSSKILKDIQVKKNTVDDVVNIYESLLEQAEYLRVIAGKTNEAIGLRNMQGVWAYSDRGMVHRDYTDAEQYRNIDTAAVDAAKSVKQLDSMISSSGKGFATKDNVSESLDELEALKTKSAAIFNDLKDQLNDLFDFSKLNPDYSYIESITNNIYEQFKTLQANIKALDFSINVDDVSKRIIEIKADQTKISVDGEASAANDAGTAFSDAADAKRKFSEANREAAKTADQTVQNVEDEADALEEVAKKAEQSAGKIVEANDKFDKIKYINDIDENGIPQPRSKVTIGTDKKENAYETTSTFLEYDEESGKYIQKAETIVKDFKKRATELKKETAKIELAKKTVAKFLSQFNNKTAGHGSDIAGYTYLENFKINNLDDIENAMQQMIDLDTKYNELTRDFRKGTKSMNPFVNAFNSMDEMRNKVKSIQIDFANLKSPTETLERQVKGLPELLEALNNALTPDENGAINIENIAKSYGNLNEAIKQAKSSISVQNKEQKSINIQEDDMWAAYNAEKEIAFEKERQIELGLSQHAAEEAAEAERRLIQSKKEEDDFFNAADEKELNALYKERSSIITHIIQLNKKLITLKTDKAKERTKTELRRENDKLASVDFDLNEYGDLVNLEKIQKQNKRLSDNNIDIDIKQTEKEQKDNQNAYDKSLKLLEKIYDIKKKLVGVDEESSDGQELNRKLSALQEEYRVSSDLLNVEQNRAMFKERIKLQKELLTKEKEFDVKQNEQAEKDRNKQEISDIEYLISLYKDYADSQLKLQKMQKDPTDKSHASSIATETERRNKAMQVLAELGIDVNNIEKSELLTQKEKNALLEERIKLQNKLQDIDDTSKDKVATKVERDTKNYGKTIFNREKRNRGTIDGYLETYKDASFSTKFLDDIKEYKEAYEALENLRKKFEEDPGAESDTNLKNKFQESALNVEKLRKGLISTFKEYQKFLDVSEDSLLGEEQIDINKINDAKTAMIEFANKVTDGKFIFEGFNASGTEMYGVLNKGNGILEKVTVSLSSATNEMKAFTTGSKQVTTSWSKLGNELKNGIKQIVGQYIGFHELWQAIRTGIGYVREIDLALTELRKVTNETDTTYKNFLKTMSQTGSTVGATVADLTSSAADWARLNI